ncbi:MAG: hypothetical protein WC887_01315 [Candidatus Paceibacterota bacterium]|jgi:hypothetical protein
MNIFKKIEQKIRNYLSHTPKLYALVVGIGIVVFWRGVWHTADYIHTIFNILYSPESSTSLASALWWDGPLSFVVGVIILNFTGAFTSSFIGNELILSGLRGERQFNKRAETELKDEEIAISDIKDELLVISEKLEVLKK